PTLNLPKASSSGVRCSSVTPDSAFFITAGDALLRRPPELLRDFSSLAEQERFKTLFVPHLLTGYKSPATAGIPALRQLKIAMVSALYQRRALRHPEHFVFGICHTRISSVSVVSATWVPRNPPNGEEGPRDAGEMGDCAHASTSKATLEASRQSDELEIKFYFLALLDLELPIDLVRLYLLVLATMPLADVYRRQLIDEPPRQPPPSFIDWADDRSKKRRSQTSGTRTSGHKRARLELPPDPESGPDAIEGDTISNYRPDDGEGLDFTFKYGAKEGTKKDPKEYIDLAMTQPFFTSNMQDNYGRGRDGDAAVANAQDGSGYNNADFMAPPDGKTNAAAYTFEILPLCTTMVTLKLALSPTSSRTIYRHTSPCQLGLGDFSTSSRAGNQPMGIRNYVYWINMTVNPLTYKTLDRPGMQSARSGPRFLWVVSQKATEKHSYSTTLSSPQPFEDGTIPIGDFYRPQTMGKPLAPKHGNMLMVQ
ncbi:Fungalysin/Thermolysin Extracellular metalloproteinase 5, partial [Ceratobasidium sp. 370]